MKIRALLFCAAAFLFANTPAMASGALLRGLDKITGIAHDFTAPIGKRVKFGTLDILARACVKRPPSSEWLQQNSGKLGCKRRAPEARGPPSDCGWALWSPAAPPSVSAITHATPG